MTDNRYRGEYEAAIGGRRLTLRFSHQVQGRLRTLLGPEWQQALSVAMAQQDVETLDKVAALALAEHHPELDADALSAWSPPVMQLVAAISRAYTVAFYGPEEPKEPQDVPEGKLQGTRPSGTLATLWWKVSRWQSARGSVPGNSGG